MRLRDQKSMMAKRLKGHLPVIDICGKPFFIDIRAQQLRSVGDYGKYLPFYYMKPDPMTHGRVFLYDPDTMELLEPLCWNPVASHNHDRLVLVHLPMDLQMDPIGVAQMKGYNLDLALRLYPLQRELKAVVTELDLDLDFDLGVDCAAGVYCIDLIVAGMGRSQKSGRGCFAKERKCCKGRGEVGKQDVGRPDYCKYCGTQL